MAKRFYIAYGSNLNLPQMRGRCPGATIVGTAVIENYRLLFKGSKTGSYLTIEPWEGGRVPVAVWEVTAADERSRASTSIKARACVSPSRSHSRIS